jgi:hypothetical protein
MLRRHARSSETGQILVIVGSGMLVFLFMVALVIDGGHAWGQQRNTQNGTDAAAEAGAVVLAKNLPFAAAGQPLEESDADVLAAIQAIAADNSIVPEEIEYTDFDGNDIGATVGDLGSAPPPPAAEGVRVTASHEFDTLLAGIMGFNKLTARADATAVAGYIVGMPGDGVLPMTFPVTVPYCDGQNDLVPSTDPWTEGDEYILYLCSSGPGNVGWLDWTVSGLSEGCSGTGTAELVCSIENLNNPEMSVPGWYYVAETGNINAGTVDAALEDRLGETVTIPLFDATCDSQPPTATDVCTTGEGTGQNQWYHFKNWISFTIEEVHVAGGNPACLATNGSTGCLIGTFVQMFGPGTIASATGDEHPLAKVGVQLIQ